MDTKETLKEKLETNTHNSRPEHDVFVAVTRSLCEKESSFICSSSSRSFTGVEQKIYNFGSSPVFCGFIGLSQHA